MLRLIVTAGAAAGLEHCRKFLVERNPQAAKRAAASIARQLEILESKPDVGRPLADVPELRELIVAFGDSGYVALYRHEPREDAVYVLAFRHQKEAGY